MRTNYLQKIGKFCFHRYIHKCSIMSKCLVVVAAGALTASIKQSVIHRFACNEQSFVHLPFLVDDSLRQGVHESLLLVDGFPFLVHNLQGVEAQDLDKGLDALVPLLDEVLLLELALGEVPLHLDEAFPLQHMELTVEVFGEEVHGDVVAIVGPADDLPDLLDFPDCVGVVEFQVVSGDPRFAHQCDLVKSQIHVSPCKKSFVF